MKTDLLNVLLLNETDIDGVLQRLSGNEELYEALLGSFLNDTTMDELKFSIEKQDWNEAFTAAHAMKGLAGNFGFVPLFHRTGELVLAIRKGKIKEINETLKKVEDSYIDIINAIKYNI